MPRELGSLGLSSVPIKAQATRPRKRRKKRKKKNEGKKKTVDNEKRYKEESVTEIKKEREKRDG